MFTLPDLNGLDLQRRVTADRAAMPIIFITGYGDIPMTVQAMKAGAIEFLTKPFGDEVLLAAIRSAIARSIAALQADAEIRLLRDRHASLSPREREVMALVVCGLLNKQVGGELGISEITGESTSRPDDAKDASVIIGRSRRYGGETKGRALTPTPRCIVGTHVRTNDRRTNRYGLRNRTGHGDVSSIQAKPTDT